MMFSMRSLKEVKMSNVVCKTLLCQDGVVGLNGYQYLLDDYDNEMEFASEEDAVKFLLDNGYNKDWIGEWLEFETTEKRKET